MDIGKKEDRIRTETSSKIYLWLFAVISRIVTYCMALELASRNLSFERADQANLACYKAPVPYIDLVAESRV